MEEIRSFLNGINTDANPLHQPQDTYRDALNFVQVSEEGNMYALTNERGTVLLSTSFPSGFRVIGHTILDTDVIVVLADTEGNSQIGTIDSTQVYTRRVPTPDDGDLGNQNRELGFSIANPVDIIARKRLAGDRIVYFCDGPQGRPLGRVNLDNPPATGDIDDNARVIPSQMLTQIDLVEVQEVSGNLRNGIYHFATRYYTEDLTPTSVGIPSGGVPIVEDSKNGGRDQFDGEYPDFGPVNKAIELSISNVDTSYPFMSLIVIRYESITNTLVVEEQPIINVTGETMFQTYSGDETDVRNLTQEELNRIPISYNTAKAVTQKDNIAFWSNLTDNSNKFDLELQELFNNVSVEYVIKEVNYAPSGAVSASGDFMLTSTPFTVVRDETGLLEYIVLQFNSGINFPLSQDVNIYTFFDRGENATAEIRILNPSAFHNGTVGDTIEIAGVNFQAVLTSPTNNTEFDVSSNNLTIILDNLNTAISNNPTVAASVSAGTNAVDTIFLVANDSGIDGNTITTSYIDNTASTAIEITGFSGGADSNSYTPTIVELSPDNNNNELYLLFEANLFPNQGIPAGGTLNINNAVANDGDTFSISGTSVTSSTTATQADNALNLGEFTDYKNEALTFYFKGYRRREVYSFGGVVNFKDGAPSFNYHIPGNRKTTLNTTEATRDSSFNSPIGETFGTMGTYVSETDYPTGQRYPGNLPEDDTLVFDSGLGINVAPANRFIRHHKMPTLEEEPHFRIDENGGTKLRILGVRFTFNTAMSLGLRESVQSITFTREQRNTAQNRSIWAQGLATRYLNLYRDFPYRWDYEDDAEASNGAWRKVPFFNNTRIVNERTQESSSGSIIQIGTGGTAPSITCLLYTSPSPRD